MERAYRAGGGSATPVLTRRRRALTPRLVASGAALALTGLLVLLVQGALASHDGGAGSSDQRVIGTLASIAAHQTHGWSGDAVPITELEADIAAGRRVVISCGTVARLGIRAARTAGYEARLVASITRDQLTGDDGHTMLEVRLRQGWTVFDLDNNRMAQPGVGLSELVRAPSWRVIANDAPYNRAEIAATDDKLGPAYYRSVYAHLGAWYRRVLGVPLIYAHGFFWFHDAQERARAESFGYRWASGAHWLKLNR